MTAPDPKPTVTLSDSRFAKSERWHNQPWTDFDTKEIGFVTKDDPALDDWHRRMLARIEADRAAAQERDRQIAALEQERDDDTATIKRLNATVTAQAEALKSLEWCMPSYSEGGIDRGRGCPSCGGHEYGTGYAQHEPGGHRDKCRLAAALKPESTGR